MKTPLRNKKGQYAVPLILGGTIALFFVYLILVYPSERAKILGSDEYFDGDDEEITESPLGENTSVIYSSGENVIVGRAIGQSVLGPYKFGDTSVRYPAIARELDSAESLRLSSSFFSSDLQQFSADNLNLENTKEIEINLMISEVKGNPKIIVLLNQSKIYEKLVKSDGEYTIKIKPSLLDEEKNPIYVKVEGGGLLSNYVDFEKISVKQYYYDSSESVSPGFNFNVQANQYRGDTVHLNFDIKDSKTGGDLMIKIGQSELNKKIVWSGAPDKNTSVVASFDLEENIMIGDNEILFEAEKEGSYIIENITIELIAESALPASKTYSFDISKEDYYTSNRLIMGIKIDRIIEPGYLFFKISPGQTSYYFPTDEIAADAWVYVTLDKTKMKTLGNKITVDSVNGRFKIDGFIIISD